MSEGKVKLPREVVEAMEVLDVAKYGTECLHDIPYMIRCVKDGLPDGSVFEPIVEFYLHSNPNKITYINALVNGYEVEESPYEKVRGYYEYFGQDKVSYAGADVQNKIEIILTTLGIKIEGVNA